MNAECRQKQERCFLFHAVRDADPDGRERHADGKPPGVSKAEELRREQRDDQAGYNR